MRVVTSYGTDRT